MCSRILAAIFIIYCLNSAGFCEDLIDLSCKTNSDCNEFRGPTTNTSCRDDKCVCFNVQSQGDSIDCKPATSKRNEIVIVGQNCPCSVKNSYCDVKHDRCLCSQGFIESSDKHRCIPENVALGGECESQSQCISRDHFAECDPVKRVCSCQHNFTIHDDYCLSLLGLEKSCHDDDQCNKSVAHSICSLTNRKCACSKGFVAKIDQSSCLPKAGYNEKCIETTQCRHELGPGSTCNSGVCTCDGNHYKIVDGTTKVMCQLKIAVGNTCREHNECYLYENNANEQSMECHLGECACREGYEQKDKLCYKNGAESAWATWNRAFLVLSIFITTFFLR